MSDTTRRDADQALGYLRALLDVVDPHLPDSACMTAHELVTSLDEFVQARGEPAASSAPPAVTVRELREERERFVTRALAAEPADDSSEENKRLRGALAAIGVLIDRLCNAAEDATRG